MGLKNHSRNFNEEETNEASEVNKALRVVVRTTRQVDQANPDGQLNFSFLPCYSESSNDDIVDNIVHQANPDGQLNFFQ